MTPQHPAAPEGEGMACTCGAWDDPDMAHAPDCEAMGAAPEGETDASGLTEAEKDVLDSPLQGFGASLCGPEPIYAAVQRIVAERLRVVEGERDRWQDKAQEAGEAYGLANSRHHEELDRANRLERLADRLAERAVELEDVASAALARAESAEAAHATLVAGVEALADEWAEDYPGPTAACNRTPDEWATDLRALLAGGGA